MENINILWKRMAKWSIGIGISIIFLKIVLALFKIVFLPMPGHGEQITTFVYWLMDNLDMDLNTALALDFTNSTAPWIAGILIGFGLLLNIFCQK